MDRSEWTELDIDDYGENEVNYTAYELRLKLEETKNENVNEHLERFAKVFSGLKPRELKIEGFDVESLCKFYGYDHEQQDKLLSKLRVLSYADLKNSQGISLDEFMKSHEYLKETIESFSIAKCDLELYDSLKDNLKPFSSLKVLGIQDAEHSNDKVRKDLEMNELVIIRS